MPRSSIDFQEVNNAALADLPALVGLVDQDFETTGDELVWIDPQRPSRKRGDSKINRRTGRWSDFASGDSGSDPVSWWAHCHGQTQIEAARELARRYGLETTETRTKRKPADRDGDAFRPAPTDAPEPNWKELGNPRRWCYRDAEGRVLRYHLRYDRPDGTKDFRPLTFRLLPGDRREWRTKGLDNPQPLYGLDRLAQRQDAPILVVEGEKTADAAAGLFPNHASVTSGSSKSARHADWSPLEGRDVTIWPDADEPGARYAEEVAKAAHAAGAASVRVVRLPADLPQGWDVADEIPEHLDAWILADSLADARPVERKVRRAAEPLEDDTESDLPVIRVRPPEHEVAAQAQKALAKLGTVFQRRGGLVHVHRAEGTAKHGRKVPPGTPSIRPCTAGWLREQLSKAASFQRADAEGQARKSLVPDWLPRMVLESSSHPGLSELTAVVETPVYLPGGRILTTPGLDGETGVFFAPLGTAPAPPEHPSQADAQAARDRLFHVVTDFPWAGGTAAEKAKHRAAWLGFVLTAVSRYAIQGPVPFVLIEANTQASGKGLLAQVTGRIATGRDLPVATAPRDGVELRKLALPIISEGTRIQMLDEVGDFAGSREFNGLVTSTVYRDRVLGTSSVIEAPQNTIFVLCGNNVQLASDSTRRCLAVRLEPMTDRPEDREDFVHPDLLGFVSEHAASLNADALTIMKAFHSSGSPASGLKPWGSFESWARLIRDAVFWVTDGVNLDTRADLASTADTSRMALGQLVGCLDECFPGHFTADLVLKRTLPGKDDYHAGLAEALESLNVNPKGLSTRSVGRILSRCRRTVANGRYLDMGTGTANGSALWRVQAIEAAGAA